MTADTHGQVVSPIEGHKTVRVVAALLGDRLALQAPPGWTTVANAPLLLRAPGGGCAAVFRYGVVVFFEVGPAERQVLPAALSVRRPLAEPGYEEVTIRVEAAAEVRIEADAIWVPDVRVERLQLIAVALAKSVALEHHEHAIATSFDTVEPLARELHLRRRAGRQARELLSHIGDALLAEHRMAGRVEVREKPDLLWDRPDLERFYARLEDEYELRERAAELERKLELTSRTARTALELLQNRRSLRVEWYIVVLIVIEIGLTLYQLWWR